MDNNNVGVKKNIFKMEMKDAYEDSVRMMAGRDKPIHKEFFIYENEGVKHEVAVYMPNQEDYTGNRPAIVFFFGGGYAIGCKEAFEPQAEELARQGYVAFCPDYRITALHGSGPMDSINDGVYVWKYIRDHAHKWNVDVMRMAVSGGSAGGTIAIMCGPLSGEQPAALVLFNPGVSGPEKPTRKGVPLMDDRIISKAMPPMLIMLGESDEFVSIDVMNNFVSRVNRLNVPVKLVTYPDMNHGFFNFNRSRAHYFMTLGETLLFLDNTIGDSAIIKGNDILFP